MAITSAANIIRKLLPDAVPNFEIRLRRRWQQNIQNLSLIKILSTCSRIFLLYLHTSIKNIK